MGKAKNKPNAYVLFAIAVSVLTGAFLMRSFPILIFAGLAPLFAVSDHAEDDSIWNKLELVGVALAIALWAGHFFNTESLITAILQAIVLTLAFVVYAFARQNLGAKLGKLPLIFFWLALEYLFLKFRFYDHTLFLADSLALETDWHRWTAQTGYLGISGWVLLANLALYHGTLHRGIQIPYLVLFCLAIAAPIVYSYTLDGPGISRLAMTDLYSDAVGTKNAYADKGEWIVRTGAWVSALVILFAIVKSKTRKK